VTAVAQALAGLKVLEFSAYGAHIGGSSGLAPAPFTWNRNGVRRFRINIRRSGQPSSYNRSGCFAFQRLKYSVTVDLKSAA
jgi:hypothetical protein